MYIKAGESVSFLFCERHGDSRRFCGVQLLRKLAHNHLSSPWLQPFALFRQALVFGNPKRERECLSSQVAGSEKAAPARRRTTRIVLELFQKVERFHVEYGMSQVGPCLRFIVAIFLFLDFQKFTIPFQLRFRRPDPMGLADHFLNSRCVVLFAGDNFFGPRFRLADHKRICLLYTSPSPRD